MISIKVSMHGVRFPSTDSLYSVNVISAWQHGCGTAFVQAVRTAQKCEENSLTGDTRPLVLENRRAGVV